MAKYLNYTGLQYFYNKLKTLFVSDVTYNSSTNELVKKTYDANGTATYNTLLTVKDGAEPNVNAYTSVRAEMKNSDGLSYTERINAPNPQSYIKFEAGNNIEFDLSGMTGTAEGGAVLTISSPTDETRVPTTRKVNGHALSSDVTITKSDLGLGNVDNTADANKSVATAAALKTPRTIDGIAFDGSANVVRLGTCATPSATALKVVTLNGYSLVTGAIIYVKFNSPNTVTSAASLQLNVNNTGAHNIKNRNGTDLGDTAVLKDIAGFIYDGTNYRYIGDNFYTMLQGTATAGTDTVGRLISAKVLSDTINNKIETAIAGITQISYQIVDDYSQLPATGSTGVIYLIKDNSKNTYKEYIWITDRYELLGDTAIEIEAITNSEIDSLFA